MKKKGLIRLIVTLCSVAMIFTGFVFAVPQNTQSVYACSENKETCPHCWGLYDFMEDCETCGGTGEVEGECEASETYTCDETQHWRVCVYCGEVVGEKENHIDANSDGKCDKCGYNMATTYTVTFNLAGGSSTTTITDLTNQSVGTAVTLPTQAGYGISRSGYTFKGWALTNGATETLSSYSVSADNATSGTITLYAVWTKDEQGGGTVPSTGINFNNTAMIVSGGVMLASFGAFIALIVIRKKFV